MSGVQPGLTAAGAAAAAKPRIKATVRLQHMKFMKQAAVRTQAAASAASSQEVQISLPSKIRAGRNNTPHTSMTTTLRAKSEAIQGGSKGCPA